MADATRGRDHRHRPLSGRDPRQTHRAATPLELLYDLTFVVAFGAAADERAHHLAEGHLGQVVRRLLPGRVRRDVGLDDLLLVYDNDDWGLPDSWANAPAAAVAVARTTASELRGGPSLDPWPT